MRHNSTQWLDTTCEDFIANFKQPTGDLPRSNGLKISKRVKWHRVCRDNWKVQSFNDFFPVKTQHSMPDSSDTNKCLKIRLLPNVSSSLCCTHIKENWASFTPTFADAITRVCKVYSRRKSSTSINQTDRRLRQRSNQAWELNCLEPSTSKDHNMNCW